MILRRALPLALTVLSLAACTEGTPAPPPAAEATTPPATATSQSPLPAYRYSDLDLCAATDLAPLAALKLTLKEKRRAAPDGYRKGEGEACLHEMTTSSGDIARLTVEAIPAKSADEAQGIYRTLDREPMKLDGAVAGPWEQGEGRTLDTVESYKHSRYQVQALSGNLYVSVWLAVGGDAYTPKEKLAPIVEAIAAETYATVARAWK
ncbi:hypothetical protein GCM10022225_65670 [Plantactinospora mayteni]|uniref:DUF3558 domain-containing protein n=1 Tax=Plantactinospora mayteni TaxID=566021 RepID=A0ABQ4EPQ0_9ACTN|nr:hypothetical protein [Plantactinospora mayteni]GIG96652.1 hypothetical protein Pma05_32250 [Plantactinospora mayteni]